MSLHFQLISATGLKFDDECYEALIPTKDGQIAVFEGHMPLISAGAAGVLSIRKRASDHNSAMEHFAVYGGALQVDGQSARFVSDDITSAEEVSEQEALEALARAQKLVDEAGSHQELQQARTMVQHHEARLNLSRLKRRHHQ